MKDDRKASTCITLRPLAIEDYETVLKWSKDDAFCSANGWELNRSPEELDRWWGMCVENVMEDFLRMGIECDGKLIGYADLAGIQDGCAELGIAIGDSEMWGKGLGSRAALAMMDFAAEKLSITGFTAETNEANVRSRKMLEKIGFEEVGSDGREEYMGMDGLLIQYKLEV